MKTIAFVGSSGTGKSYRAQWVAKENGILYIIDDGLLISENSIIAGFSAKKEETRLASVRRALFMDEHHVALVKDAIKTHKPQSILILGTSIKMIEAIATALDLPLPDRIIKIEDVASKEEIEQAQKVRLAQGKHVIPVPTFEIKRDFSGYFLDSVKSLFHMKKEAILLEQERSIVRPTFSYRGDYIIANKALMTISEFEAKSIEGVNSVYKVFIDKYPSGVKIGMELSVTYGLVIPKICYAVQEAVGQSVENYTGMNVLAVNIFVKP